MIEPWHWLVLGFSLLIVEMFVPTFASLWFGVAAVIIAALASSLSYSIIVSNTDLADAFGFVYVCLGQIHQATVHEPKKDGAKQ